MQYLFIFKLINDLIFQYCLAIVFIHLFALENVFVVFKPIVLLLKNFKFNFLVSAVVRNNFLFHIDSEFVDDVGNLTKAAISIKI